MSNYTKPQFDSAAIITIDVQRDTLDGQPLEISGTSAALPNIKLLLELFRQKSSPIVHVVRIYKKDGSNVDLCRKEAIEGGVPWIIEDSNGCQLAGELFTPDNVELDSSLLLSGRIQKVSPNEVIIYKPRWGAFYKTSLEEHLRVLGVTTLVFTGCNFPNCPRTSIYEASERDFRIVLATDAVSGLYKRGQQEMKNIGVELLNTQTLVNILSSLC
jgi:nicotinamidase-related amidase